MKIPPGIIPGMSLCIDEKGCFKKVETLYSGKTKEWITEFESTLRSIVTGVLLRKEPDEIQIPDSQKPIIDCSVQEITTLLVTILLHTFLHQGCAFSQTTRLEEPVLDKSKCNPPAVLSENPQRKHSDCSGVPSVAAMILNHSAGFEGKSVQTATERTDETKNNQAGILLELIHQVVREELTQLALKDIHAEKPQTS